MTTTYSLGVDRHISQVHFPTQIRALLRRIEHNNSDVVEKARDLTQLIALFEEVQDAQKIRLYSGQLLNLAKKGKMKPGVGRSFAAGALLSHGRACLIVQDYDAAIDSFQQYALYGGKMSNPMDNRDIFFNSLFNLGLASLQRGESKQEVGDKSCTADFEDAHVKFLQLHSCFDKEKLTPEMRCDVLMNLGIVFGHQGNPQKALTCLEKSLKMAHERKDTDTISRAYFNLAALFKRVNNFDKALEYIKKELLIHKNSNNVEGCLETQYEIALLQQQMHKYQEAIVSTQTYIQLAKKLSDNNAGDKGLDLMRELEESVSNQKRIQVLSEKLVQLRSRKHSAAAGGGKREEFRVLMEIAGLKMSLHMFTDALKDFQTLNLIIQALPVSSQEKDAITKGLGDAYAGAGQFEDAVPQFRALLNRLTGLTKTRAEVLWKLADCLGHLEGTCEQIAAPLIECERIGVHLQDLQIQWEAQNRLSVLYNRFQYYEKAKRAEFIADQLDKRIDAEGISREKDYEEEEDNDGDNQDEDEDVVGGITGDACDDEDIISGSGSDAEESRWIKKHGKEKTRREVNGGRRTSAVVKKLDLKDDIESSQEINKKPRVKRRIIPLQSSSSWSQHAPAKQTKKTIMSSSSDVEDGGYENEGFMLTSDRLKSKRKSALDLLKEKKKRKGPAENGAMGPSSNETSYVQDGPIVIDDDDLDIPDLPPPQYYVGDYIPPVVQQPTRPSAFEYSGFTSTPDSPIQSNTAAVSAIPEQSPQNFFAQDDDAFPEVDDFVLPPPPLQMPEGEPSIESAVVSDEQHESILEVIPNTPLNTAIPAADPAKSSSTPKRKVKSLKGLKVRVQVGDENLLIPCSSMGTPKTVRWLQNEVVRRYKGIHRKSIQVDKLVIRDDVDDGDMLLFKDDILNSVVTDNQKIHAVLS